jgi:hypothetical protein
MFTFSLADGSEKAVGWTLPDKESCIFLHRTPSNHVLAVTAEAKDPTQMTRTSDRTFGKLVVFKDGRANVLLDGMDAGGSRVGALSRFLKGRPAVDTPQGTFIATMGRGIVFVSSDASRARRFDWRFNIPTLNVTRMRVRDNLLYLLDSNAGLAVVDWTRLIRMPEPPDWNRWDLYTVSMAPAGTPDGAIWWLDQSQSPGRLNCWRHGTLTQMPLDGRFHHGAQIQFIASDTQGGLWLMPTATNLPIACLKHGIWRYFDNADAAWSNIALEEKDNPSFGFMKDCIGCPAFGGSGQAAYRDRSSSIRCFDGLKWQAIGQPAEANGPLYFENGALTVDGLNQSSQFKEGRWGPKARISETRSPSDGITPVLMGNFPGDRSRCRIYIKDTANVIWAGNPGELYRGLEDIWVRFRTIGTPLSSATYLTQVLTDDAGELWFFLNIGQSAQLAHYRYRGNSSTIEWATPPPAVIKTGRITFACRVPRVSEGRVVLRYRVDEEPWRQFASTARQPEIVVENLLNGMHKIEVRAYDNLLRASPPLTSTFEVRRNYAGDVHDLIPQLNDPNKREAAARALVAIGRPAVPALTDQREQADARIQWWIRAILDEIGMNEKKTENNAGR